MLKLFFLQLAVFVSFVTVAQAQDCAKNLHSVYEFQFDLYYAKLSFERENLHIENNYTDFKWNVFTFDVNRAQINYGNSLSECRSKEYGHIALCDYSVKMTKAVLRRLHTVAKNPQERKVIACALERLGAFFTAY
jgi:hypothetical protein